MFCQFIIINRKWNEITLPLGKKKKYQEFMKIYLKKKISKNLLHFFEITSFDIYMFWFEPHFYLFETFLNHCTVYMYIKLVFINFPNTIIISSHFNHSFSQWNCKLHKNLFVTLIIYYETKTLGYLISNKSDNFKKVILSQYMRCTSRFEFFDGGTNNKSCNQS